MDRSRRLIAWTLTAVTILGALPASALAQIPIPPPPRTPASAAAEATPPERMAVRGPDAYDVGATVVTVAKAPFTAALCAIGGALGTAIFLMTLGSGYKASARVIEEGCSQPWIVSGDDLRPSGAPGIFPDRPSDPHRARR
jgi:hypothetical protein